MSRCNVCNKEVNNVVDHIRKVHMGKFSKDTIRYLRGQGVRIRNVDDLRKILKETEI